MADAPIEVVVFDFDGVLVDSVAVKTAAFAAMYEPHGRDVVDAVVAYHHANAGIARHTKLAHYERELLGRDPGEDDIERLADEFARRVVDAVVAAPPMPGAEPLLAALHGRLPLYVASGTPQDELRDIVSRRGWAHLFDGVFGSPTPKGEILAGVVRRCRVEPDRVVMIGDGTTDLQGARAAGTWFVGVRSDEVSFPDDTMTVGDLDELFAWFASQTIDLRQ